MRWNNTINLQRHFHITLLSTILKLAFIGISVRATHLWKIHLKPLVWMHSFMWPDLSWLMQLFVDMAVHKVTRLPVCSGIITPDWKAIDQRTSEATKVAGDEWPSRSSENQRLFWPWSRQTWKARAERCTWRRHGKHPAQHFNSSFNDTLWIQF